MCILYFVHFALNCCGDGVALTSFAGTDLGHPLVQYKNGKIIQTQYIQITTIHKKNTKYRIKTSINNIQLYNIKIQYNTH